MKKQIIFAALLIVAGGAVTYRLVNQPPSADLPADKQMMELLADAGCMECHVATPKYPFYASLPVVGDVVKEDIQLGYRSFDIAPMTAAIEAGKKVSEVDLAKVEKVIKDGTMPLAKYYLVHWGASMTDTEKTMALNWIRSARAAAYPNPLAAAEFANEPVRPIADSVEVDMRKVILGDMLFHDTRLSIDNTVSCATCHALNTAGVDNKQFSEGVGGQKGGVNAPTVFNAHYNFVQFWDGRAATLAAQAGGPPLNPVEMGHKSFDDICARLAEDANFKKAFTEVYPDGITEANVTDAIQEFERTLLTPNSRFDKYLKGDKTALTSEEIAGYDLFKKYN
ncbi:MAG: cytochrome c peroxidase, partial [Phocaeicola sp.]|nr:cytochrome c peroxidase [Phocaeicola sp.]